MRGFSDKAGLRAACLAETPLVVSMQPGCRLANYPMENGYTTYRVYTEFILLG